MFAFAQISDIHLGQDRGDGGARARERTERVLARLAGLPGALDAVLLTGDVADHGTEAEYRLAAKLFDTYGIRPLLCPGNHDVRGPYRQVLLGGDPADPAPVNQVHRLPGATFLMCDSSVPGKGHGRLDDGTLAWLDETLARTPDDEPAFVCFHHPPVPLHVQYVDEIRQFGEDRLAEVVGRHRQVAGLLCGHSHTPAVTTFAGVPLVAAPGVVSTLRMPWEEQEAGPMDYELPPMLAYPRPRERPADDSFPRRSVRQGLPPGLHGNALTGHSRATAPASWLPGRPWTGSERGTAGRPAGRWVTDVLARPVGASSHRQHARRRGGGHGLAADDPLRSADAGRVRRTPAGGRAVTARTGCKGGGRNRL